MRHAIGYAQQDAFLFSTTVARNIGFCLDEPDSPEARERDPRRAPARRRCSTRRSALPDGFDTVVGERGVQLSGGQKQRIALARALVWQPKVLVLDDPLSAVDAETEAAILDAIEREAARRTVMLITHRVAAAARCDRIVVLDAGHGRRAGHARRADSSKAASTRASPKSSGSRGRSRARRVEAAQSSGGGVSQSRGHPRTRHAAPRTAANAASRKPRRAHRGGAARLPRRERPRQGLRRAALARLWPFVRPHAR